MPFQRHWQGSQIWQQWTEKGDEGTVWTIKDLLPEDDAKAVDLIIDNFLDDEILCVATGLNKDPESIQGCRKFWSELVFPQRVSLACYRQQASSGVDQLVALNGLVVKCVHDEKKELQIEGEPAQQVVGILGFMEERENVFKSLGVDKYLSGAGLVVSRQFRGRRLGAKLLESREPLCKHLGLKATATVFSGPYSQKAAADTGFHTLRTSTLRELSDLGFRYPRDEREIKLMAKVYQH